MRERIPGANTPMALACDRGYIEEWNVRELFNKLHALTLRDPKVLPTIVIIGDKASGKTSIFEALTGLSFPVAKRPLTSFAIHTQFKRTTSGKPLVKAHIRPGPLDSQYDAAVEHLQRFEVLREGSVTGDEFLEIVQEAANHMGLIITDSDTIADGDDSDTVEDERQSQVSDNILMVEISGPEVHNLSIIDFPGFMRNLGSHDLLEIKAIRDLVLHYIQEPQNIILAVIDATNEIGNQEALELARGMDPEGHRTVGVLTKCDVVQPGDETRVLKIANNKKHHLHQGWFAVKNRSVQERHNDFDLDQRNMSEHAFFSRDPWNTLNPSRVGLTPLREFLGDIVQEMLQENINTLVQTVLSTAESRNGSRVTNSISSRHTGDEKRGSLDYLHPVHKRIAEVDETDSSDEDLDLEAGQIQKRPTVLINAFSVGLTVALVLTLVGLGCQQLAQEVGTDGSYYRLLLLVTAPMQVFVSLFFCQSIISAIFQILGPVSQLKVNSKFYSANTVRRLKAKNGPLPHVTVQCPVYKEGLDAVIKPTVESLEAAIRNYESHGGTANIFMNDDGMQLLSSEEAAERRAYYSAHNIGWVARPKHNPNGEGLERFIRRGKFKKASNMNFAMGISLKVEDKLVDIERSATWTHIEEEATYRRCLSEVLDEELGRAWAEGDIRIGDYILIVDSDTRIPEECMIDAVSELEESPRVAILQFSSGVMNVTTSYFETGITFFTNLIYTAIRYAVANGDASPFVGHNAFLRWSALQEVSFTEEVGHDSDLAPGEKDPNSTTPYEKFWSESHVSEDFDISLRLQTMGYYVRLGAYCGDGFKEGVSLTVYDELARWEKYAYGCNELLFHPLKFWWRRGPFTPLFKRFIFSNMPLGSKVTILAYVGTYYAIGYAWIGTLMNYFLVGWLNGHLDHYYMNSWRVWVALIVVFSGAGNLALALIRYRGENLSLGNQLWTCFRWVPLLFVFLGGISMHVSQAILCHMFSIDMTWGATAKEVTDTSFFVELPIIARRFKFVFIFCIATTALLICGVVAFPYLWRINQLIAIFPLACVVFGHFFLPVLLNPALMKFTW
ncbi:P-loop containing nucleoside triphosphate hydrolase protein [Coniochaeta ligniaria NRRL 30616]|uniref:p-loop containing nucleoside triphosphate hydrolase protein n=1 Tax=Coniochaeta ligniaria NRRL 30616 TaxID=1408157 RepID=A0A1J7JKL6_9PEZI|nr:P-loop containing nucleoside triphosphate hydrolase protein [Coniochaeta ligniaria NRRL 30616]